MCTPHMAFKVTTTKDLQIMSPKLNHFANSRLCQGCVLLVQLSAKLSPCLLWQGCPDVSFSRIWTDKKAHVFTRACYMFKNLLRSGQHMSLAAWKPKVWKFPYLSILNVVSSTVTEDCLAAQWCWCNLKLQKFEKQIWCSLIWFDFKFWNSNLRMGDPKSGAPNGLVVRAVAMANHGNADRA